MPLEDLDLEFEDDEDVTPRSDALHRDVVIEFGSGLHEKPPLSNPAALTSSSQSPAFTDAESSKTVPKAQSALNKADASQPSIKRLDDVRAKLAQSKPAPTKAPSVGSINLGNAAVQLQSESEQNVSDLVALMEKTKFEARVEVAVAQQMSVYMAEMLSDAKLLQHQVQQMLLRLNQKNPASKPELVAIQKVLADFINKKRKFPHE